MQHWTASSGLGPPDVASEPLPFEAAAHLATDAVPIAGRRQTVSEVLRGLAGGAFKSASHVVCDGQRFAGIAPIETLFAARGEETMKAIMDQAAPVVRPGTLPGSLRGLRACS